MLESRCSAGDATPAATATATATRGPQPFVLRFEDAGEPRTDSTAYELLKATHDTQSPASVLSPYVLECILRLLLPVRARWPPALGPCPPTDDKKTSHLSVLGHRPAVRCTLGPALVLTCESVQSGSLMWSLRMTGSDIWCIGAVSASEKLEGSMQWGHAPCGFVNNGAGPVQQHLPDMHNKDLLVVLDMDARKFQLQVDGVWHSLSLPDDIRVGRIAVTMWAGGLLNSVSTSTSTTSHA
eukprot:m51a1_g10258 hypothetical protein (240) ;mRNA; r:93519-95093